VNRHAIAGKSTGLGREKEQRDPTSFKALKIVLAAGGMSENTPHSTENTPNSPPPFNRNHQI
jgi:hypothetical protein